MNALQVMDRSGKKWCKWVHKRMIKRFSIFTISSSYGDMGEKLKKIAEKYEVFTWWFVHVIQRFVISWRKLDQKHSSNTIRAAVNKTRPVSWTAQRTFLNVATPSGVHLFDHLLWLILQSSITHYISQITSSYISEWPSVGSFYWLN